MVHTAQSSQSNCRILRINMQSGNKTIDYPISAVQSLGKGTFMAQANIQLAFRLYPVHPSDWELLGMQWKGEHYFDAVFPFGLRSAPGSFNQLSDAITWISLNIPAISEVGKILDDFLF